MKYHLVFNEGDAPEGVEKDKVFVTLDGLKEFATAKLPEFELNPTLTKIRFVKSAEPVEGGEPVKEFGYAAISEAADGLS